MRLQEKRLLAALLTMVLLSVALGTAAFVCVLHDIETSAPLPTVTIPRQ